MQKVGPTSGLRFSMPLHVSSRHRGRRPVRGPPLQRCCRAAWPATVTSRIGGHGRPTVEDNASQPLLTAGECREKSADEGPCRSGRDTVGVRHKHRRSAVKPLANVRPRRGKARSGRGQSLAVVCRGPSGGVGWSGFSVRLYPHPLVPADSRPAAVRGSPGAPLGPQTRSCRLLRPVRAAIPHTRPAL